MKIKYSRFTIGWYDTEKDYQKGITTYIYGSKGNTLGMLDAITIRQRQNGIGL